MYTQLFPKAIRMPSISACKARQRIVQLEVSKEPTLWVVSLVRDAGQAEQREPRTLQDDMTIIILSPQKKSPENYIWIQHDDFKKAMFFYETWQFEKLMQCIKKPLPGQESESLFEALAWGLPKIWWSRQPSRCFATFHISRYLMMIYLDTPCNL